jgi:hypothetical protein
VLAGLIWGIEGVSASNKVLRSELEGGVPFFAIVEVRGRVPRGVL